MRCGERPGPALQLQLAGRSADRCPPAEMGGSVSDIPRGERNHRLSWKPVGTESMSSTPRLGACTSWCACMHRAPVYVDSPGAQGQRTNLRHSWSTTSRVIALVLPAVITKPIATQKAEKDSDDSR